MHLSNNSEREKLILYFYQLQKLDPIVKVFSDRAFRSYVCFPYVKCNNPSGKSWVVEVLVAEDFGVEGNYNPANRDLYQKKLIEHMKSTHACLGTYRGHDVYHYYNPKTDLNVMVNRSNNKFISGWRLSPEQILNMKNNGNIQ